jgi:hypothetical protein
MEPVTRHPALIVAALASAGAGLVHAAAAGTHQDEQSLVVLFSLCAIAQLGWALLVLVAPRRGIVVLGAALNAAAAGAWVFSRTTGLPLVDALREQEAVGRQDLVAAVLAGIAVLACGASLLWPRTTRALAPAAIAVLGAGALAFAYAGVAAPHGHAGTSDHAHAADAVAHEHEGEGEHEGDAEDADGAAAAADDGHEHHDAPDRLDHEPTDAQRADADRLVEDTTAALARYDTVDDAVAAGYTSIGDGRRPGGYEHFINPAYTANAAILDPTEPESLVFRHEADGTKTLTTAMYILPPGSTMDDVPDIAGNLTVWHAHDNLCFAPGTLRLAGVSVNGQCRPAGEPRQSAPMLHVWVVDNPCGPFAGTDRQQATGSCT